MNEEWKAKPAREYAVNLEKILFSKENVLASATMKGSTNFVIEFKV